MYEFATMSETQNTPNENTTGSNTVNNNGNRNANDINKESKYKSNGKNGNKSSLTSYNFQPYNFNGRTEEIGGILALKNERFAKKVSFSEFQEKLQTYTLTKFDYAKDMISIINEFKDPITEINNEQPTDLTEAEEKSNVKKWMKMEQVKKHIKRLTILEDNKETLFGLIWGQCSSGLQAVLKNDSELAEKQKDFDCVWFLTKVKTVTSGVDDKENKQKSLLDALTGFFTMKQGPFESNDVFCRRVDSNALTVQLVGGKGMLCSEKIIVKVKKDSPPTDEEIKTEIEKLKAMVMMRRADPGRFGSLLSTLDDGVNLDRDEYPETVTAAYELLQRTSSNISGDKSFAKSRGNRMRNKFTNVMFAQRKTSNDGANSNSPIPGRNGKVYDDIECYNCNERDHYSDQCTKADRRNKNVILAQFILTQQDMEVVNKHWLLLDTCSTVSVCCNSSLITNIQQCASGDEMTIITNGGKQHYNSTAELKILTMQVHYNSTSLANILSLSDVANLEGARITMDTELEQAINLHYRGKIMKFEECADGLYYLDTRTLRNYSNNTITPYLNQPPTHKTLENFTKRMKTYKNMLQTVTSNKEYFTQKEIKNADTARKLQSQLGWPSTKSFK